MTGAPSSGGNHTYGFGTRAYHGVSFYGPFGDVLSPPNAWLLLQGADMVRLSVCIKDVDNTLWDIGQALGQATA